MHLVIELPAQDPDRPAPRRGWATKIALVLDAEDMPDRGPALGQGERLEIDITRLLRCVGTTMRPDSIALAQLEAWKFRLVDG